VISIISSLFFYAPIRIVNGIIGTCRGSKHQQQNAINIGG